MDVEKCVSARKLQRGMETYLVRVPSDSKINAEMEIFPYLDAPPVGELHKHAVIRLSETPKLIFKKVIVDSQEKHSSRTKNPTEKKTSIYSALFPK